MDLTLDVENYKLNIRAGIVIIHQNCILTHKNINYDLVPKCLKEILKSEKFPIHIINED